MSKYLLSYFDTKGKFYSKIIDGIDKGHEEAQKAQKQGAEKVELEKVEDLKNDLPF